MNSNHNMDNSYLKSIFFSLLDIQFSKLHNGLLALYTICYGVGISFDIIINSQNSTTLNIYLRTLPMRVFYIQNILYTFPAKKN